jgi:hypothetical protein
MLGHMIYERKRQFNVADAVLLDENYDHLLSW